jgi:Protein of unknown function (DUF3300)
LVAFPAALMQLNDHLDWTQNLGDAMLSQQQDVADSIQRLRARAADAGNLQSGAQQTVSTQGTGNSALSGVNRGQQVNREAARGRAQQSRAGDRRHDLHGEPLG